MRLTRSSIYERFVLRVWYFNRPSAAAQWAGRRMVKALIDGIEAGSKPKP